MVESPMISGGVHYNNIIALTNDATKNLTIEQNKITEKIEWKCSADGEHNRYSPVCVIHNANAEPFTRHASKCDERRRNSGSRKRGSIDKMVLLNVVNEKLQDLPKKSIITSNHVLINNTRVQHGVLPLIRDNELDEVASEHAKRMAFEQKCEHSNLKDMILKKLGSTPWRRIGENICYGKSLGDIHTNILNNPAYIAEKNNMVDRRFSTFGVGVATCPEGEVYVCQIYKA